MKPRIDDNGKVRIRQALLDPSQALGFQSIGQPAELSGQPQKGPFEAPHRKGQVLARGKNFRDLGGEQAVAQELFGLARFFILQVPKADEDRPEFGIQKEGLK